MERGKVVRSAVSGVPAKGRDTMGVVFAKPDSGDRIIAVARNPEGSLIDLDEPVDGESAVVGAGVAAAVPGVVLEADSVDEDAQVAEDGQDLGEVVTSAEVEDTSDPDQSED
jgi:DNA gyrase subunit A